MDKTTNATKAADRLMDRLDLVARMDELRSAARAELRSELAIKRALRLSHSGVSNV